MPKGMPIYGKKVAARRRKTYLTQATVAKKMGMSTENVKRIERGEITHINPEKFPRLADALGMSLKEAERELKAPVTPKSVGVLRPDSGRSPPPPIPGRKQ